jgi:hypothetical protein
MGSFTQQPAALRGFWSLKGNDVQIHDLPKGNTHEYRFFVEWVNTDGDHRITLVADQGFTTMKEAKAFRAEALKLDRVRVIAASEYDVGSDVAQWTKHHASPHPEAQHSDFPWGSPMQFVSES